MYGENNETGPLGKVESIFGFLVRKRCGFQHRKLGPLLKPCVDEVGFPPARGKNGSQAAHWASNYEPP